MYHTHTHHEMKLFWNWRHIATEQKKQQPIRTTFIIELCFRANNPRIRNREKTKFVSSESNVYILLCLCICDDCHASLLLLFEYFSLLLLIKNIQCIHFSLLIIFVYIWWLFFFLLKLLLLSNWHVLNFLIQMRNIQTKKFGNLRLDGVTGTTFGNNDVFDFHRRYTEFWYFKCEWRVSTKNFLFW